MRTPGLDELQQSRQYFGAQPTQPMARPQPSPMSYSPNPGAYQQAMGGRQQYLDEMEALKRQRMMASFGGGAQPAASGAGGNNNQAMGQVLGGALKGIFGG